MSQHDSGLRLTPCNKSCATSHEQYEIETTRLRVSLSLHVANDKDAKPCMMLLSHRFTGKLAEW